MQEEVLNLFRQDYKTLDQQTQSQLFSAFFEFIYKDLYFLLNDHMLVEEVIQDSFLKALKHGPKTYADSNIKAWLRRVSRNTALDLIRKNKKHRQLTDFDNVYIHKELAIAADLIESLEDGVVTSLRNEALYEVLNEINEEYRIVLMCHYIHGMSYKEIQKELGITKQVLASRLSRARHKLNQIFSSKWVSWSE